LEHALGVLVAARVEGREETDAPGAQGAKRGIGGVVPGGPRKRGARRGVRAA